MTPEEKSLARAAMEKLQEDELNAFVKSVILEYVRSPEFKKELQNARDGRNGRRRVL